MEKTSKQILLERMVSVGGMPINEDISNQNFDDNSYAEKAGQGKGIITTLVENIEETLRYLEEMESRSPELMDDIENIRKRLTIGLDRAKMFSESKKHKKNVGIRGLWGIDDDKDGFVDGSADGGFGDGGGGGE